MDFTVLRLNENDMTYAGGYLEFFLNQKKVRSNAFEKNDNPEAVLHLPRALGAVDVALEFFYESGKKVYRRIPLKWLTLEDGYDVYFASVKDFRVGLYFYRVVVRSSELVFWGTGKKDDIRFSTNEGSTPQLQLSISDFAYRAPESEYGGIIYHIFVDRFARGGDFPAKPGARTDLDFTNGIPEFPAYPGAPLKNNSFWGGTLCGIAKKLDYLSELGVTLIYLSPIFDSPSNHKYDTADYMTVDSMFGGEKALIDLIRKAESYGIGIILDGVFNHTGADSIYFNKYGNYNSTGAYQSKQSPYYSWYEFQKYPDSYTCWWGIDILPRINPEQKSLCDFISGNGGVIQKYRKMGVRGFRLDVVDELSDAFVARLKSALDTYGEGESLLYGEVWEDASNKIAYGVRKKYYLGKELDGVMNYPVREGIISYLRDKQTEKLRYALVDVLQNTPERILHMQMNLLGSHDTVRILTALARDSDDGLTNEQLQKKRLSKQQREIAVKRLCMAYSILATIPGVPSVYYGDEAGLEGYRDPFNRMPFPWDSIDEEIRNCYVKIGQIRKSNDVYRNGKFQILHLDSDFFAFARTNEKHYYITVVNNSQSRLRYKTTRKHTCLMDGKGRLDYCLPAESSVILRVPIGSEIEFSMETKDY